MTFRHIYCLIFSVISIDAVVNVFAKEYPRLADYGLSIANVAFQTALAGVAGLVNSVRADITGRLVGVAAGEQIGAEIEYAISAGADKLLKLHPELSLKEARALAGGALLGTNAIAQGASGIKQVLKHMDKPHVKVEMDGSGKVKNDQDSMRAKSFDSVKKSEVENIPTKEEIKGSIKQLMNLKQWLKNFKPVSGEQNLLPMLAAKQDEGNITIVGVLDNLKHKIIEVPYMLNQLFFHGKPYQNMLSNYEIIKLVSNDISTSNQNDRR